MRRPSLDVSMRAWLALALVLVGAASARSATVTITAPKLQAAAGKEVDVPILVKGGKGAGRDSGVVSDNRNWEGENEERSLGIGQSCPRG